MTKALEEYNLKLQQARFDLLNRADLFLYRANVTRAPLDFRVIGTEYHLRHGWDDEAGLYGFYFYRLFQSFNPNEGWTEIRYSLDDVLDELSPAHQEFFVFHLDWFR